YPTFPAFKKTSTEDETREPWQPPTRLLNNSPGLVETIILQPASQWKETPGCLYRGLATSACLSTLTRPTASVPRHTLQAMATKTRRGSTRKFETPGRFPAIVFALTTPNGSNGLTKRCRKSASTLALHLASLYAPNCTTC